MQLNSKRELDLVSFALEYLAQNLDAVHEDEEPGLHPVPDAEEIYALVHKLKERAREADRVKLTYILHEDGDAFGARVGQTLEELLDSAGSFIDNCMEPPVIVFQTDHDEGWHVASIECVIAPANPAFVREFIETRVEEIEDQYGEDLVCLPEEFGGQEEYQAEVAEVQKELVFLKTELAKLPEREDVCPPDDDGLETYEFTQTRWDAALHHSVPVAENAVWYVNAENEVDLRYWASFNGISYTNCLVVPKKLNAEADAVVVPDTNGRESWEAPQRRRK